MEIEFDNREKEIEEIKRILSYRPDSIYFVYGPINSGKSSLMDEVVKKLSDDYVIFFVDLRAQIVSNVDEFYDVLFSYEVGLRRRITKFSDVISSLISSAIKIYSGFPLPENLIDKVLRRNKPKNAFTYIFTILKELKSKGKKPVIIMDELQTISDLKIDGPLIYELFNFFVTITKRHHLSHVFTITSDSLFIEKVFNEAMLQGRCDYLLVDDFDYNTTVNFLKKYGFSKEEIDLTWNYFGGKPVYLVKAIKNKHRLKDFCEESLNLRVTEIKSRLKKLKELGERITIGEEEFEVEYDKVLSALSEFKDKDFLSFDAIDEITKHYLIKINLLFLDPLHSIIKPQSRLDLLVIRRILEKLP